MDIVSIWNSINWMATALVLFMLLLGGTLYYTQIKNDKFDLRYLVTDPENQQPSLHKTGQLIALFVSSWGFIYLVLHSGLSEVYFVTYMGTWTAATVANKWIDSKAKVDNTNADTTAVVTTAVVDKLNQ